MPHRQTFSKNLNFNIFTRLFALKLYVKYRKFLTLFLKSSAECNKCMLDPIHCMKPVL